MMIIKTTIQSWMKRLVVSLEDHNSGGNKKNEKI